MNNPKNSIDINNKQSALSKNVIIKKNIEKIGLIINITTKALKQTKNKIKYIKLKTNINKKF